MKRVSLYYILSYLLLGGLGFSFLPSVMLDLFQSTGSYDDVMIRLVGTMMLAIAVIIISILKTGDHRFYLATIPVRLVICTGLAGLYLMNADPMFLILLGIVGLGLIATIAGLRLSRS